MSVLDPFTLEENQMIERKETFNDRGLKTLCAFLNTDGGSLYLPVRDNGKVKETPLTDEQQQNIANKIISGLGVQPNIVTHTWDNKAFIEIKVPKAPNPVPFKGSYYLRVGNTTQRMSQDQLRVKMLNNVPWDSQICNGVSIEELDKTEIKRFVKAGQEAGRINAEVDPNEPEAILRQTNLIQNDALTNAAILLFGEEPQRIFSSAKIRIGVFIADDRVVDDKTANSHLFHQIRRAEEILKSHMQHGYEISDRKFTRKEKWKYPLPAFREGIVNAVIHRDYHRQGAEVQVKIFPDHLSIFSPGGLPEGLSVEELLDKHPSIKRNELLANVFYRAGLIEIFGTGISRIQKYLKEANLPELKLQDKGHSFVVTFNQKSMSETSQISVSSDILNLRQKKILDFAKKGSFQTSDIKDHFPDVSVRTLRKDLTELVERDFLITTGKTRKRKYYLNIDKQ
ncbi:MAG: hypothetical protein FH748_03710 [Balneolaceae bacterium]|nr:hypothetical protein [Balneolaceae bacterium]